MQTTKKAKERTSQKDFTCSDALFQRAWLQGILISASDDAQGRFVLNDGTGIIHLPFSDTFFHRNWKVGMSVHEQDGCYVSPSSP
ncbi:hypothetical protein VitviT2T_021708 [Vitis vinifera]|uniref:Uncharacterized protein n=2 Tax=Vitis vinifera TaxID=29760 RepID=A0ABY9D7S6_VITVI|nr:hypothetical protein CK203_055769 [Vitis vinifera]WKA03608.1 hypothetical protein VitviT2T_021708 [Vitis vinifera]